MIENDPSMNEVKSYEPNLFMKGINMFRPKKEQEKAGTNSDVVLNGGALELKHYNTSNKRIIDQKKRFIHHFDKVLKTCEDSKVILDLKYHRIGFFFDFIQVKVILLSALSAFIQGDESMLSINTQVASFISICIATYISLVLSITKYLKLSEKKEAIVNLRDKFSSLHNKIKYKLDSIYYWNFLFNESNKDIKSTEIQTKKLKEEMDAWHNFKLDLNTSYYQFIEYKLELMTTYEGLLDSNERKKFEIIMRKLKLQRQKRLIRLKQRENKHTLINKRVDLDYKIRTHDLSRGYLLKEDDDIYGSECGMDLVQDINDDDYDNITNKKPKPIDIGNNLNNLNNTNNINNETSYDEYLEKEVEDILKNTVVNDNDNDNDNDNNNNNNNDHVGIYVGEETL